MSKKVFIVDDSRTARCVIKKALEEKGYQVFEAEDGKSALEKLSSLAVDLLITDFNMPRMNGIELAELARKLPLKRFLPILMMTTDTNKENIDLGKAIGISTWLNKNRDMDRLPNLVNLIVGS